MSLCAANHVELIGFSPKSKGFRKKELSHEILFLMVKTNFSLSYFKDKALGGWLISNTFPSTSKCLKEQSCSLCQYIKRKFMNIVNIKECS